MALAVYMKALWYRTRSLYVWLNDSLIGKVGVVFTSEGSFFYSWRRK